MLHNRPDTNSIVGVDICVYSIVGAVGLPYGKKPLCLWASIVLWALGFTIPGIVGAYNVGTDICVYSIVGAVGLPYGEEPSTCLWASIVLWALGFTIPGTRGRAPHIPTVFL